MAESTLAHPNGLPALDAALAHPSPPPGPAHDEHSLPYTDDQPLPDGRVQHGPLGYSRDAGRLRAAVREARGWLPQPSSRTRSKARPSVSNVSAVPRPSGDSRIVVTPASRYVLRRSRMALSSPRRFA